MEELYTTDNVGKLVKTIQSGGNIADYKKYYFDKIKKELQTHTKGKLFDKVVTVFDNEDIEASRFVLDTYESVTKGSIWRGIDNLARIFNNTGFDVTGDSQTIEALNDIDFFSDYINKFVNITTATDPNAVQVWYKDKEEGIWENHFVETAFIQLINEHEIAFIDADESEYELKIDNALLGTNINSYEYRNKKITKSYFEGVSYIWGSKVKYVYINKTQYIEIFQDKNNAEVIITNFENPILSPYSFTGVEKIENSIYHSAVAGFIPFGNHALIQHRTYRSVEAIFGYPRMSEVELPCEDCVRGQESCDPCEEFPDGLRTCRTCKGSGHVTMQSAHKIYKRKLFPDSPELNANIKPVEFFTPEIGILNYNAEAWRKTLQMGEDAIYIQQRVETGNVESAKSREKQLESMYSWLGRISNVIYYNLQRSLDNYAILNNTGLITVNKPVSYAILSEIEAFEYLNSIVNTDAPVFIKTTHIENFLNKYISKTSVVIKVVDILKRVDPFVFYTTKDLQTLSDSGVINDQDWRVHAYAFPLLMMMYSNDPEFLEQPYEVIQAQLMDMINSKVNNPLVNRPAPDFVPVNENEPIENEDNEDDNGDEGRQEPEMIAGVIEILLSIDDLENRRKVLDQQITNWDNEGISYDLNAILSAAQLN